MHIVVTGNPVDGFIYHGLFDNEEAAVQFAEKNIDSGDWWIAPIQMQASTSPPKLKWEAYRQFSRELYDHRIRLTDRVVLKPEPCLRVPADDSSKT